jgi:hypothetical protein
MLEVLISFARTFFEINIFQEVRVHAERRNVTILKLEVAPQERQSRRATELADGKYG